MNEIQLLTNKRRENYQFWNAAAIKLKAKELSAYFIRSLDISSVKICLYKDK